MAHKEMILAATSRISLISKILGSVQIIAYILSFFTGIQSVIPLIPGSLLAPNLHIHSIITYGLFNEHFYCLVMDLATLFFSDMLLLPLWGQFKFIQFLLIVVSISGVMCFFICHFLYLFTHEPSFYFRVKIQGLVALTAGVTVAAYQTLPDQLIISTQFAKVKNQNLPLIGFLVAIALAVLQLVSFIYPCLYGSGIIIAWIYLRFFQKHENGIYGDSSSAFEFSRLCPSIIAPAVQLLGNRIYSLLVQLRICRKPERMIRQSALAAVVSQHSVIDPDETERRKQLALKALNDRLLNSSKQQEPWPSVTSDVTVAVDAAAAAATATTAATAAAAEESNKIEVATDIAVNVDDEIESVQSVVTSDKI